MDDDGGSDHYDSAAIDDAGSDGGAASFLKNPWVGFLRGFCVLFMFYGWTPFTLLDGKTHTFSGPWWPTLLIVWLSCVAFVAIVALIEKFHNRPARRR
jgi:hypothetical protein